MARFNSFNDLKPNLSKIKFLFIDVDGVMTDGGIYYFDNGLRARKYNMTDFAHINELKECGINIGFCTAEEDQNIILRAEKLNIKENSIFGSKNKLLDVTNFLEKRNLTLENLAFIGDDLGDLEIMKKTGLSFAVNSAFPQIKEVAHYITEKSGGNGAVREVLDLIYNSLKKSQNNKKVGIILAAKTWSSRLPKKTLLKINGKEVITHLTDRLKDSKYYENLILATTSQNSDDELVDLIKEKGIKFFRGKETPENRDLLRSFIECADENKIDIVVRICGDSPLIEPSKIDLAVDTFIKNDCDYLSYKTGDNKPIILSGWGLAVEVISLNALKKARSMTSEKIDLEHVTPFIYKNPHNFRIIYLDYDSMHSFNHDDIRLTIDYEEDYEMIKIILEFLGNNPRLEEVISFIQKNPFILKKMKELNNANKKTV